MHLSVRDLPWSTTRTACLLAEYKAFMKAGALKSLKRKLFAPTLCTDLLRPAQVSGYRLLLEYEISDRGETKCRKA